MTRPPGADPALIVLHPDDDVAIAATDLPAGTPLPGPDATEQTRAAIPAGHKLARRPLLAGAPVRRYGQVIGYASAPIAPGDHVHTHNLVFGAVPRDHQTGADVRPLQPCPPQEERSFEGYLRADGRVGTRNYLAVVSTVNCSASVCQQVRERFASVARDHPGVDGVIALAHTSGCGLPHHGADHQRLQRVLAGYASHPNVAASVIVGLGCETNQAAEMVQRHWPARPGGTPPPVVVIQDCGGLRGAVERVVAEVERLLPRAGEARRTRQPASKLVLGTNCGGSDGYSGITANPALGRAIDELVRQGGTGVLAETPETFGAEHLLVGRAANAEVARRFLALHEWWREYVRDVAALDANPSPGNKAGGITTILEKSLGAVAKGGTTPLVEVLGYAERISAPGLVFMDTPGHDPVSVTGLVAGGCNVIGFTTGRGSVFGCRPAPCIKLATHSALFRRMPDDMDLDCGVVLDGVSIETLGRRIFDEILAVASGRPTKSELAGVGEAEFVPWLTGPVL